MKLTKTVLFKESELKYTVEGYEYEEDEDRTMCPLDDVEFEGDYFFKTYDCFDDAVAKYVELKKKGWEVVRITISTKTMSGKDGVRVLSTNGEINVSIELNEVNKKLTEAFSKIKQIIESI